MSANFLVLFALLLGYLFGSVPFGLLLTRLTGAGDLRNIGSGNIGATNVLRTGRKDLAAATLFLDGLKGFLAVLVGAQFGTLGALAAGLGAFIGHCYPLWLRFRGGKGVATFLGIAFAISWKVAIGFCILWMSVALITRYSSLSALIATAVTPLLFYLNSQEAAALLFIVLAAIAWYKHRENISRLLSGTESRIGSRG